VAAAESKAAIPLLIHERSKKGVYQLHAWQIDTFIKVADSGVAPDRQGL
jgi:hypothetical protein